MAKIALKILHNRRTASGKVRIYISLTFKQDVRYISTGFEINNESEFEDGKVCFRKDAAIMNKRLAFVLDEYREKLKRIDETMPVKPILFVDECDTLLCSRQNPEGSANSSLINVQNTVTEIWLQELDKFEGILFLTTNNASHMDEAIARRITHQIHIGHPSHETQVKIWKYHFPELNEAEAREMANTTNFTGGQILTVKKKVQFKEILDGPVPFEELQRISGTNGRIQKRNPVGFGR